MIKPTIETARDVAITYHKGQVRDFSGEDYVNHPFRVSRILYDMGFSTDMVIAAILHDTLEDTTLDIDTLTTEFGEDVANLVWWVSEPNKLGESKFIPTRDNPKQTKQSRKQEFNTKLRAAPVEAQTLKVADIIDNTLDMIKYGHINTGRAERFAIAKRTTLHLLKDAHAPLLKEAFKVLDELDEKLVNITQYVR